MQRSQVPKFGNWEGEENVPYTAYFDNARKNRGGGKMNPNDPEDNPDIFSDNRSAIQAPIKDQKGTETTRSKHERRVSREDSEFGRLSESPLHPDVSHKHNGGVRSSGSKSELDISDVLRVKHERQASREEGVLRKLTDSPLRHDNVGRRGTVDSPQHRHGGLSAGDTPKRGTRQSVGSDRSTEQSPLHPHYQARVGGRGSNGGSGVSSPSWEKKGSDGSHNGLAPSTPGRSRLRSVTRGDETPDHSPAVPKFGDWDESDPAAAEGYTHIFNRVREEKQTAAGKVPAMPTDASYSNGQKNYRNENSKSCGCFPWGGK